MDQTQGMSPRDELLNDWANVKAELAKVKQLEAELRSQVVEEFFPKHKEDGTETVELGNDWKLKSQFKLSRTIDKAALPAVLERLPEGIEDHLIRYKPELDARTYKKLSDEHRSIMDEAMTIKPSTPQVSLVPPKA